MKTKDSLAAMIVVEMLVQGIHFDSQSMWRMPIDRNQVWRAFRTLVNSGVIEKLATIKGRYRFTEGFVEAVKRDITKAMPRGVFLHYPDLGVFDIAGMGLWTDEEYEIYGKRQREHWMSVTGRLKEGAIAGEASGDLKPSLEKGGEEERTYSTAEAAQMLHVTTQTLRNWARSGKIRLVGLRGKRRVPETELRRCLCA